MAIRNLAWYDRNSARDYPLDDAATAVDDNGVRLPSHFLADLHLKFPRTAGTLAYLGGITVSPKLVTVTIMAADNPSVSSCTPLAVVSLPRPVDPWRQYAVEAIYPGTGGWIVFGHGINDQSVFTARFSRAAQSRFAARAAWTYEPLPVPSMAVQYQATSLTGVVRLVAGNDLEIVGESVPGLSGKQCAVVRLKNTSQNAAIARNVFQIYCSPCLHTPESENCGDPPPIQFLGPVQPDCCGNITLKFFGRVRISAVTETATVNGMGSVQSTTTCTSGVVIDSSIGLSQACVTVPNLPDDQGNLPNSYPDFCSSLSVPQAESISESVGLWYDPASFSRSYVYQPDALEAGFVFQFMSGSLSESYSASDSEAMYSDDFQARREWLIFSGYFDYVPLATVPHEQTFSTHFSNSAASMNVALAPVSPGVRHRKVSAVVMIDQGDQGSNHNAAVLAAVQTADNGSFTGYCAEIDWDAFVQGAKLFRIAYRDGTSWFTLAAVDVPNLALAAAYRISLLVFPRGDQGAWLVAELSTVSADVAVVQATLGPIAVHDIGSEAGLCGLYTKQSRDKFMWFGVEEI